jgi:hypothetical protein
VRSGRFAVLAVVLLALLAAPLPPAVRADPDTQAKLRRLTRQAADLNKLYRGTIESLEDTRLAAKKAADRSSSLRRQLAEAEGDASEIAHTSYIAGPVDGSRLLSAGDDPRVALARAAAMQYLARERAAKLDRIKELVANAQKARAAADQKIDDLQKDIKKMQTKRREVEKLLAKYGFQTPVGGAGLTARMITVRDEVLRNFPMPYNYGCLRAGDAGEHGKGRACDFMMSSGGRVAGGADADRGDALAQWLIDNGQRLGVMYIIWKQRYYDIRTGGGWDPMSDRGGTTANHWDHVHVSVF